MEIVDIVIWVRVDHTEMAKYPPIKGESYHCETSKRPDPNSPWTLAIYLRDSSHFIEFEEFLNLNQLPK